MAAPLAARGLLARTGVAGAGGSGGTSDDPARVADGRAGAPMLTLLCPGLLDPMPIPSASIPGVPSLARMLARADALPVERRGAEQVLLGQFGIRVDPPLDTPTAALAYLGESPDAPADDGDWLHADPVHLRPDRDHLRLFAGPDFAPDRTEADDLVALFNGHFGADDLWLTAPHPSRWYLRSGRPLDLRTVALRDLLGRPVPVDTPSGADARRWRSLLNEVQMLFHASPVNRRREADRRPTIGGIWIWGGGALPETRGDPPESIVGDDPLCRGLARRFGIPHRPLAGWRPGPPFAGGGQIVWWDRLRAALHAGTPDAPGRALVELDAIVAALADLLGRGALDEVRIDPCDGVAYRATRGTSRRIWRRFDLNERWSRPS